MLFRVSFSFLFFLFRTNRKCYSKSYLITPMLKVLSQQLRGTMAMAFERHLIVTDFTDMDQHTCLFVLG